MSNQASVKAAAAVRLREFALWRANGEYFSDKGSSLMEVARRWKHAPEPGAEIVAVLEMKFLVFPSASGLPFQFAALSSKRA